MPPGKHDVDKDQFRAVVASIYRKLRSEDDTTPDSELVRRAFAIATRQGQRHGWLKPGTQTPTRRARTRSALRRARGWTDDAYEDMLARARRHNPLPAAAAVGAGLSVAAGVGSLALVGYEAYDMYKSKKSKAKKNPAIPKLGDPAPFAGIKGPKARSPHSDFGTFRFVAPVDDPALMGYITFTADKIYPAVRAVLQAPGSPFYLLRRLAKKDFRQRTAEELSELQWDADPSAQDKPIHEWEVDRSRSIQVYRTRDSLDLATAYKEARDFFGTPHSAALAPTSLRLGEQLAALKIPAALFREGMAMSPKREQEIARRAAAAVALGRIIYAQREPWAYERLGLPVTASDREVEERVFGVYTEAATEAKANASEARAERFRTIVMDLIPPGIRDLVPTRKNSAVTALSRGARAVLQWLKTPGGQQVAAILLTQVLEWTARGLSRKEVQTIQAGVRAATGVEPTPEDVKTALEVALAPQEV